MPLLPTTYYIRLCKCLSKLCLYISGFSSASVGIHLLSKALLLKVLQLGNMVSSQLAESQIAGSQQSENQQCDNKYIYPDCRHRQFQLGFIGSGSHFYVINNSILEFFVCLIHNKTLCPCKYFFTFFTLVALFFFTLNTHTGRWLLVFGQLTNIHADMQKDHFLHKYGLTQKYFTPKSTLIRTNLT